MKITCKLPVACKYWDPEKNRCMLGYKKMDASHMAAFENFINKLYKELNENDS